MKKAEEKINEKDIETKTIKSDLDVYVVNGRYIRKEFYTKQQLASHRDCNRCGVEFKKPYTFSKHCETCEQIVKEEEYKALPLVEWNGTDALAIFDSDIYFFDEDDIVNYLEDNDLELSDLQLVLCEQTKYNVIDIYDLQSDVTHEDWEPSSKLQELVDNLNDYFKNTPTNTWSPSKKRVTVVL